MSLFGFAGNDKFISITHAPPYANQSFEELAYTAYLKNPNLFKSKFYDNKTAESFGSKIFTGLFVEKLGYNCVLKCGNTTFKAHSYIIKQSSYFEQLLKEAREKIIEKHKTENGNRGEEEETVIMGDSVEELMHVAKTKNLSLEMLQTCQEILEIEIGLEKVKSPAILDYLLRLLYSETSFSIVSMTTLKEFQIEPQDLLHAAYNVKLFDRVLTCLTSSSIGVASNEEEMISMLSEMLSVLKQIGDVELETKCLKILEDKSSIVFSAGSEFVDKLIDMYPKLIARIAKKVIVSKKESPFEAKEESEKSTTTTENTNAKFVFGNAEQSPELAALNLGVSSISYQHKQNHLFSTLAQEEGYPTFFDVILKVRSRISDPEVGYEGYSYFLAHKGILSARSAFFRTMFDAGNDYQESRQLIIEMDESINSIAFLRVKRFIYMDTIFPYNDEVTLSSISSQTDVLMDMLQVSIMLSLDGLTDLVKQTLSAVPKSKLMELFTTYLGIEKVDEEEEEEEEEPKESMEPPVVSAPINSNPFAVDHMQTGEGLFGSRAFVSSGGGLFGSGSGSGSGFGGFGGFGGTQPAASSGGFGTSGFGQSSGGFTFNKPPAAQTSSLFGSSQSSASPSGGFSFGAPSQQPTPPQSGGFGGSTTSSSGGFSFGAPSTQNPSSAAQSVTFPFSFDNSGTTTQAAPQSGGFSFNTGTSQPSSSLFGSSQPTQPASGGFSFGGASQPKQPASSGFSFGTPAQPSPKPELSPAQTAQSPSPGFSFPSQPSSGFGASTSQSSGGFSLSMSSRQSFNSSSSQSQPAAGTGSTPSSGFSFSTQKPATAESQAPTQTTTQSSGFSFDTNASSPAVGFGFGSFQSSTQSGGFSFGGASQPKQPAFSGFSFGTPAQPSPKPEQAASSGFSFATTQPAPSQTSAPTSGGFDFGFGDEKK